MKLRLWLISIIILLLTGLGCSMAYAADIQLTMNGEPVKLANYEPVVIDDQPMLPIRDTFTMLGAEVSWDAKNKAIIGKKNNITITMFVGTNKYKINDLNATMDATTVVRDGVALASAKYVLRGWRYQMDWNKDTKVLNILDWEHYNALMEERKKELLKNTTTKATTTTTVATTIETTTETTTTLQQVINSGPVFGTNKRMSGIIIQDCKVLARGYSLGMSDKMVRMQAKSIKDVTNNWSKLASSDIDKKYVAACKTVYTTFINKAKALDKWTDTHKGNDNLVRARKYKESLADYLYSIGKCTSIEELTKLNADMNKLRII